MSTLGVLAPLKETVIPAFQDGFGCTVETTFTPTTVINQKIADGERGEVLIAISDAISTLASKGIVERESIRDIASTSVGLGKVAGTSPVDISSKDALVNALLGARSIVVSQTGASGIFFRELVARLGIADQLLSRVKTIPQGLTAELLITGDADIAVQQVSELRAVAGVEVIGALPAELNHITTFTAALFAGAAARQAGILMDFITGPLAMRAYAAGGLMVPNHSEISAR